MDTDPTVEVRRAGRSGLSVALATSAYGVSFGALATVSGLNVWQTCVLSLMMFTGGSQFAFIGVIGAGGLAAAPAAVTSAALLGVRNVAYGIRMSQVVGTRLWRRAAAAHFTIDESTGCVRRSWSWWPLRRRWPPFFDWRAGRPDPPLRGGEYAAGG